MLGAWTTDNPRMCSLRRGIRPGKEVIHMAKIGRNAGTGRFTSVKTAQSKPKTHVVETIKK